MSAAVVMTGENLQLDRQSYCEQSACVLLCGCGHHVGEEFRLT